MYYGYADGPSDDDFYSDREIDLIDQFKQELMEDREFLDKVVTRYLDKENKHEAFGELLIDWIILSKEAFEEKFDSLIDGLYMYALNEIEEQAIACLHAP